MKKVTFTLKSCPALAPQTRTLVETEGQALALNLNPLIMMGVKKGLARGLKVLINDAGGYCYFTDEIVVVN